MSVHAPGGPCAGRIPDSPSESAPDVHRLCIPSIRGAVDPADERLKYLVSGLSNWVIRGLNSFWTGKRSWSFPLQLPVFSSFFQ